MISTPRPALLSMAVPVDGLSRRRFLRIGGVAVAASAALAACSASGRVPAAAGSTTTTARGDSPDVGLLRLASSIEHTLVQVYMTALGSGVITTASLGETARYFADQHVDHARLMETRTTALGGQPFSTANQAVLSGLQVRIDGLTSEADVLRLAYDMESMASATYYAAVGGFIDPHLDGLASSVGGVEARHMAALGMVLSGLPAPLPSVTPAAAYPPYPKAGAFQTTEGAVPPGTGI